MNDADFNYLQIMVLSFVLSLFCNSHLSLVLVSRLCPWFCPSYLRGLLLSPLLSLCIYLCLSLSLSLSVRLSLPFPFSLSFSIFLSFRLPCSSHSLHQLVRYAVRHSSYRS